MQPAYPLCSMLQRNIGAAKQGTGDGPHMTGLTVSAPVVIKKYANRRLYNTQTSQYITLEQLAKMVRAGCDFQVLDAKTGVEITHAVLAQIIVDAESRGAAILPTAFLRQIIGLYGETAPTISGALTQLQDEVEALARR